MIFLRVFRALRGKVAICILIGISPIKWVSENQVPLFDKRIKRQYERICSTEGFWKQFPSHNSNPYLHLIEPRAMERREMNYYAFPL